MPLGRELRLWLKSRLNRKVLLRIDRSLLVGHGSGWQRQRTSVRLNAKRKEKRKKSYERHACGVASRLSHKARLHVQASWKPIRLRRRFRV